MRSQEFLIRALSCLLVIPAFLSASPLMKMKKSADTPFNIGSAQAHDFLTNSRPKRNVDPRWYRADPNFQSYYRFYTSIGHPEGIYEIDKIRILYQQMRYLEHTYGPDASSYQNAMGVLTTTAAPTTTQPPPPPTTPAPTPDPLASAQRLYLCNPKDPLCKPQIVYLPTGAVPVLCDPRSNPACRPRTEEEIKAAAPVQEPAAPPAPKKSAPPPPPPPPAVSIKGMEYDCDPYWDPDCLIDHPPRAVVEAPEAPAAPVVPAEVVKEEVKAEESAPPAPATEKTLYPLFDPYDFKRDLYDPFAYSMPAAEPEE